MTCKAQRQGDEMFCAICDLRWDVNDAFPPLCTWTEDAKFIASDQWEEKAPPLSIVGKMETYEVKIRRTIEKTITFSCEADPLLNKMDIARECVDQIQDWDTKNDDDFKHIVDVRKVPNDL